MTARRMTIVPLVLLLLASLGLAACGDSSSSNQPQTRTSLHIVSGSENETLEPIIQAWGRDNGVGITMTYLGSLDIMLDLEDGITGYDAVWPANSIWLALGDQQHIVKHAQSILRSPVVLGVKKSIAENLGWTTRDVYVEDILNAAEAEDFQMMMTSATQSNSGASAYLAFLYAFAGSPDVLTSEDLNNPAVAEKIKRILGSVDRSSGSSGWLKDLCLNRYEECDAMVNYEAVIIEANQQLTRLGREPLYAIYPVDGLAIADSPMGYVNQGDAEKEQAFLDLQTYLLSESTQQEILRMGRRTGVVGMNVANADKSVFNPDWGIDVTRAIVPITFPNATVIREALVLYQTAFRKPSFTIYCLDFSGSMQGEGEKQLETAMRTLLDQETASQYLLQGTPDDITIVLIFNDQVPNANEVQAWTVQGNDPQELRALYDKIANRQPDGGTNIYMPVQIALDIFFEMGVGNRFPAVILMTDGQSNEGSYADLRSAYDSAEYRVPVFAITFGNASTDQLKQIADLTSGRIFDGTVDLIDAFRKAKGYN